MSDVLNAVMAQYETNTKSANQKAKVSDEERQKKYFSTNLPKNKKTGEKIFRILPPKNGKSPFQEVWLHEMKVGEYWTKLYCPKKNKTGECPLCEVEKSLLDTGSKEDKDIASQYRARKFYIVKGIDREHEEDGPKFWRFRHNYQKQGVLDKIVPVFSAKGDITHPEKGRDLILSLGKDDNNYTKVTAVMPEEPGPLSDDPELAKAWIEDETTWEDVYSKKPFAYLDLVAQGEIPYWDSETSTYIAKTEWEAKNSNGVSVDTMDDDGETIATIGGGKETPKTKQSVKPVVNATQKYEVANEDNDDDDITMEDLPF